MLITTPNELAALRWEDHHHGRWPRRILMGDPRDFDVIDVRNRHMVGREGSVDRARARAEWEGIRAAFEDLGFPVLVLPPRDGLVDLVFVANPFLAGVDAEGDGFALLSRMEHPGRREEVDHVASWLASQGVATRHLDAGIEGPWEGGGDNLWHPEHRVLWSGSGFRSTSRRVEAVARQLDVPSIHLQLEDPAFYHLDTCFMPLTPQVAAWVPRAFSPPSRELIEAAFETLVAIDESEAKGRLACNFCCPDGRHVLLPSGAPKTKRELETLGFVVRELTTDEFLKSGGSLFCMSHDLHE